MRQVYLLHYFGVHTDYRHQDCPKNARYGSRILGGLIEHVERLDPPPTFFALYVDPNNPARQFYLSFGWKELDLWPDPEQNGRLWCRMLREVGPHPA